MPIEPAEQMARDLARAARACEDLRADGREVHFELDALTGAVSATLRDLDGRVLRALSPTEVLEVAAGAPVAGVGGLLRS